MSTEKKYFFMKLNPPRQSFTMDMTDEERSIMQRHIASWQSYLDDGTLIVYGPVMDPRGGYGIGVVGVDNEDQLNKLVANDPANELGSYEVYPMRAVVRQDSI